MCEKHQIEAVEVCGEPVCGACYGEALERGPHPRKIKSAAQHEAEQAIIAEYFRNKHFPPGVESI